MATLNQKSTDGRMSFVKYVTENKRLAETKFEIEKGLSSRLYTKKGSSLIASAKLYPAGTIVAIVDKKLYTVNGMNLTAVKIGSVVGLLPINVIRKPTGGNGTQYEDEIVDAFNAYIKKAGGKINIKLKGDTKIYSDIAYAVKVSSTIKSAAGVQGDPKADVILCKDKSSPTAAGSIYISHKKEGGPEAFQQYGGLSEQAGSAIYNHTLVQKFLGEVALTIGNKGSLPAPVMGEFSNRILANMSIYGPDFGKAFSLQHTQVIGQGQPTFTAKTNYTEVSFTSHMSLSGDLSHFIEGYLPVFGATFRAGRGFNYKGKRYVGVRVGIYPQKLMETRGGLIKVRIKTS